MGVIISLLILVIIVMMYIDSNIIVNLENEIICKDHTINLYYFHIDRGNSELVGYYDSLVKMNFVNRVMFYLIVSYSDDLLNSKHYYYRKYKNCVFKNPNRSA